MSVHVHIWVCVEAGVRISATEEKQKQGNKEGVMLREPRGLELPQLEAPAGWEGTPVDSICEPVCVCVTPAFPTDQRELFSHTAAEG